MRKKAILITDFRLPMILAAIQLKKDNRNADIIIHSTNIKLNDFGNNSSYLINYLKYAILNILFNIKTINGHCSIDNELLGINSSLVSITNDSQASKSKYPNHYKNLSKIAEAAIFTGKYIVEKKYDCIYLFNGRLASTEPILGKIKNKNIDIMYYEYGTTPYHFTLTNKKIHDVNEKGMDIIKLYKNKSLLPITFNSNDNAINNANNKLNNIFSKTYTELPEKNYDYCLLLSSPHEFMHLSSDRPLTNVDITLKVIEKYKGKIGAVRSHPNQLTDPSWRQESKTISDYCQKSNIDFFPPDSKINTHKLIEKSKLAITSGSSIAIDAVLLGKDVEFHDNCIYKILIEYANKVSSRNNLSNTVLELFLLDAYIWQYPLHPFIGLIQKIFGRLDTHFTKPPAIGKMKKYI